MGSESLQYNLKKFIIFFFTLILTQVFSPYIQILNVTPNLIFELVLCASLVENKFSNITYSVVFGMLYNFFNGKIFGVYILLFMIIPFAVSELYHKYFEDMTSVQTFFVVIASLAYSLLIAIFFAFRDVKFLQLFIRTGVVEFVYNSIAGIIMIMIYKRVLKKKRKAWKV